jgi:predicted ATPase/DNA-binding SARP family transcriptional activator
VIHISVLGQLTVQRDGETLTIRSARQRALLAVLAAHAGQTVSIDRIGEAMWPDAPPADLRAAVQTHVSRLRRVLGADVVQTEAAGYRIVDGQATLDAAEFERLGEEGRARLRAGDPEGAAQCFGTALALWRGEAAYGDLADRDFARPVVTRLHELRDATEEDRAEALLRAGRASEAVAALEPHVLRHPLRERARALLMRALYADGRPTDALEVYGRYREQLSADLGLEPSVALRDLEAAIIRHELPPPAGAGPGSAPATPAAAAPAAAELAPAAPAGPPVPLTPLVGRDGDLAGVSNLLARARIVTITGPGGVGKTRLAQEVAARTAGRHPDGTWWCDLSSATAGDATAVVATALGVQHRSESPLLERVVEYLRPARALVVLDSCEHVVEPVAELAEAVATGTADVRVLATSQEPLAIPGEHRWPLAPLPVPETASEDEPCIALFLQRAIAAHPPFARRPPDLGRVAQICERLDGLPLAIELAAARVATLGVDDIAAGLDERFRLLTRHRRASGGRQRSLRATVDWSFALLDPAGRSLLCALSVFADTFDVDDAAAVSGRERADVADALAALAERSLVVADPLAPSGRYRLLETLRAYGWDRLDGAARRDLLRRRAEHAIREIDRAVPGLATAEEAAHARRLDRLVPDLRGVHRHLVEQHDTERLLDLWAPMYLYLYPRLRSELYLLTEEVVDLGRDAWGADPRFACVAGIAATGAWQRGSFRRARMLAEAGLAAARENPRLRYPSEIALGDTALMQGGLTESREHFESAARHAAEVREPALQALGLSFAAVAAAYALDTDGASVLARRALQLARAVGAPSVLGWAHYAAGEVLLEHDAGAARQHLEAALTLCDESGADFLRGVALLSAVTVQGRTGDPGGALERYPELVEHWARAGSWVQQWTTLRNLADLLVRAGNDRPAAVLLGATAAPSEGAAVFGPDAERLHLARETIVERLGEAETMAALAEGAALDASGAVRFARETLAGVQPRGKDS